MPQEIYSTKYQNGKPRSTNQFTLIAKLIVDELTFDQNQVLKTINKWMEAVCVFLNLGLKWEIEGEYMRLYYYDQLSVKIN